MSTPESETHTFSRKNHSSCPAFPSLVCQGTVNPFLANPMEGGWTN